VKEDEALVILSVFVERINGTEAASGLRSFMQRLATFGIPPADGQDRLKEWFKTSHAKDPEKKEEIKIVGELRDLYGMTKREMQQLIAYVDLWRLGEKPTDERVAKWIASLYDDWPD
jgi:hypothetical protein